MPGIMDIFAMLGDIPRLGNLGYSTLAGNRDPLTPEQEELLRRYGYLPAGSEVASAPPQRASGDVSYSSPDEFPLAASHGGYAPEPPRSMRMTLGGRDITDEAGALSGGFGLPQGTRRPGGGFSQGTMDDGRTPSRAGSLLSAAEGAAIGALQGNRGADATVRSISELLYGGAQLEQSDTMNRLRAAQAGEIERGGQAQPMGADEFTQFMDFVSKWDAVKQGRRAPQPEEFMEMKRQFGGGPSLRQEGAAVNAPMAAVARTPGGKYEEIRKDAGGNQYGRVGERWYRVSDGKDVTDLVES